LSPPVADTDSSSISGSFEERFEDFFRSFLDDEKE
jgi:hypothetical protein